MVCVAAADSIVPLLFHLHVKENALLNCFFGERVCVSMLDWSLDSYFFPCEYIRMPVSLKTRPQRQKLASVF